MNSKITFELLLEIFESLGLEVYPRYSGRGMYGKKCIGFILGPQNISEYAIVAYITLALREAEITERDIVFLFSKAVTDSLGKDVILYFPRIETPEDYTNQKG